MISYEDFLRLARADAERPVCPMYVPDEIELAHPDSFVAVWDDGAAEPELEPLMEFLDDLGLRRRQVNEVKALFERGTCQVREMHGRPPRAYAYKAVSIEAVHGKLAEYGLVEPHPGFMKP